MPPLLEVGVGVAALPAMVALRLKVAAGWSSETATASAKVSVLLVCSGTDTVWLTESEPVAVRVIELNRLGLLIEIVTEVIVSSTPVELVTENSPASTVEPGLVVWAPDTVTATVS